MTVKQDVEIVDNLVDQIESEFVKRPDLKAASGVRFRRRGQEDANRRNKFYEYRGPDQGTIDLLSEFATKWTESPRTFWDDIPREPALGVSETYPLNCYLSVEDRDDA